MASDEDVNMVLVDTTVWIDFFAGHNTRQVAALAAFFCRDEDVCTCGVVLTEVLQGIRKEADYRRTLSRFDALLYLPMGRKTFVRAAELYRSLRAEGITIRKPVDCMIAAVAIEHGVQLLHNDRDFDAIAAYGGLKLAAADGGPDRNPLGDEP